jgi:hemerythrin
MGMFRWTEAYGVHVGRFDRQHQTLFRTVDDLYEALRAGHGKDAVGTILQRLIDYTTAHFAAEEAALEKNGYPAFRAHKAEHQGLVEQVLKFQKDYQDGKPGVAVVLMPFLQKWLHDHIMQTDKKYGPFLNEKGIH